jgi:hypothetical protein
MPTKKAETAALRFQSPGNRHCPRPPSFCTALDSPECLSETRTALDVKKQIENLTEQHLLSTQQETLMLMLSWDTAPGIPACTLPALTASSLQPVNLCRYPAAHVFCECQRVYCPVGRRRGFRTRQ